MSTALVAEKYKIKDMSLAEMDTFWEEAKSL